MYGMLESVGGHQALIAVATLTLHLQVPAWPNFCRPCELARQRLVVLACSGLIASKTYINWWSLLMQIWHVKAQMLTRLLFQLLSLLYNPVPTPLLRLGVRLEPGCLFHSLCRLWQLASHQMLQTANPAVQLDQLRHCSRCAGLSLCVSHVPWTVLPQNACNGCLTLQQGSACLENSQWLPYTCTLPRHDC